MAAAATPFFIRGYGSSIFHFLSEGEKGKNGFFFFLFFLGCVCGCMVIRCGRKKKKIIGAVEVETLGVGRRRRRRRGFQPKVTCLGEWTDPPGTSPPFPTIKLSQGRGWVVVDFIWKNPPLDRSQSLGLGKVEAAPILISFVYCFCGRDLSLLFSVLLPLARGGETRDLRVLACPLGVVR